MTRTCSFRAAVVDGKVFEQSDTECGQPATSTVVTFTGDAVDRCDRHRGRINPWQNGPECTLAGEVPELDGPASPGEMLAVLSTMGAELGRVKRQRSALIRQSDRYRNALRGELAAHDPGPHWCTSGAWYSQDQEVDGDCKPRRRLLAALYDVEDADPDLPASGAPAPAEPWDDPPNPAGVVDRVLKRPDRAVIEQVAGRIQAGESVAPTAGHPVKCSCGQCLYRRLAAAEHTVDAGADQGGTGG
jgi:hypothetical protein